MKKLFVVLALMCAGIALAQDPDMSGGGASGGRGGGGGGGGAAGGGGSAMPQAVPSRLDRISTTLNLNKDQKKSVKSILEDGAKEATPVREQVSKSRIAVGEAINAKKSDDEVKALAKTSSDLSSKLCQMEMDAFAKVVATLDQTQKANGQALGASLMIMTNAYHTKNWNEM